MDLAQAFLFLWGLARAPVSAASVLFNDALFATLFSAALVLGASILFREQKALPFMATALAFALLLGFFFKPFLGEERPCALVPGKVQCPQDFSLPSIHALLAFTLCIVSLGNRSFALYLPYSLFLAFSRVYLGVHTIGEVAAGLSLGFFACVLAELAFRAAKWGVPRAIHLRHDLGGLQSGGKGNAEMEV